MKLTEEYSVAAIVYYENEFLLLKYGLGHWGFVKGHIEEKESNEQAILRELEEETSITNAMIIDGFKENYDYYFTVKNQKIHKFVQCYIIKSNTKEVSLSYEHDDYAWLPLHMAIKRATFSNTKKLLQQGYKFIQWINF